MSTNAVQFPVAHEYSAAVQNPQKMFGSEALKKARFVMDGPGRPRVYSGNFASTFVADLANGQRAAVRVFLKADPLNRDERYRRISSFLAVRKPSSFATFEYLPSEVLARGHRWPVIVMEWVEGQTLDVFMMHAAARGRRDLLAELRSRILKLSVEVEGGGFAHGDLNTGNVLVSPELRHGIKLVDYDGMFVPGMTSGFGGAPGEEGTPGTRHPLRRRTHFGPQIDRFSCIVIDVCAAALIETPDAWGSLNTDASRLLFDESDLQDPNASKAFRLLEQRGSPELRRLLQQLARVAREGPENCPSLSEFRRMAGASALGTPVAAIDRANLTAQTSLLERRVIDGRNFAEARSACDSEVDVVAPIFEEPAERFDRNRDRYLFINLQNWRYGNCVKAIVWGGTAVDEFFDHAKLIAHVDRGSFATRWICVTGTPMYFAPHKSVDVAVHRVGQVRFISESTALDMLARSRRGEYRGGTASIGSQSANPQPPTGGSTPSAPSEVQSHNQRVLAALQSGASLSQSATTSSPRGMINVASSLGVQGATKSLPATAAASSMWNTPAPSPSTGTSTPAPGRTVTSAAAPTLQAPQAPSGLGVLARIGIIATICVLCLLLVRCVRGL